MCIVQQQRWLKGAHGVSHDGPGGGGANAVDVGKGSLNALLVGDVNTTNTSGPDNQASATGHRGGLGALASGRESRSLEADELRTPSKSIVSKSHTNEGCENDSLVQQTPVGLTPGHLNSAEEPGQLEQVTSGYRVLLKA